MSEEQKYQDEENEDQQEEEMEEPQEEDIEDKREETDTEEGREQDDKAVKSQGVVDVEEAGHIVKKGRGRQKKKSVQKHEAEESNDEKEIRDEPIKKKGKGKRKKTSGSHVAGDTKAGKRKRPKTATGDGPDTSDKPKAKKQRIQKERTIEPGRLRDTPRLSYKDDSSDEELNKYLEVEVVVSSDSEADLNLERRLSGKGRPEKKEAGALRERKRMLSYKDESDSDIESGFESDVLVPKKSRSPVKKGKGRPKKQDSRRKSRGKKRGRKRIHPDTGPYVPTGKPRGRPKGQRNKPKISNENVDQSKEEADTTDLTNSKEQQSAEGEANLSTAESRDTTQLKTDIDKNKESENSEENSDKESGESDQSESEEEESEMKENSTSARETMVS